MPGKGWRRLKVAELQADKKWALNGGPFGSKLVGRDYTEAGVPVIRGSNLPLDRRFSIDDLVFVSEGKADELLANNAHPGDVVFTQRGTLGQVGLIPTETPYARYVISQSQMKLTVDKKKGDPAWVYYCFRSPAISQSIAGLASSSGVPHINLGALRDFEIDVPPLDEQRRIASVLSAYDDLIENNTRRIAILEEMARRLYEEWFVRFRFPGHEQASMVESELGLVPEGWVVKCLVDVTDYLNRGLSPRYDDNATGLVINQKCIRNSRLSLEPARKQSKPVPKEKTVRFGDVLVNSTGVGTLGRVAQVYEALSGCTADSHVTIVRPKASCDIDFFGLALLGMASHFEQQGVGATGQTELSRGRIAETQLVMPPEQEQKEFGQAVRPLRQLSVNLARKNTNLRAQRDLLLPKLISGEIDVSAFLEPEAVVA